MWPTPDGRHIDEQIDLVASGTCPTVVEPIVQLNLETRVALVRSRGHMEYSLPHFVPTVRTAELTLLEQVLRHLFDDRSHADPSSRHSASLTLRIGGGPE